jgi:hypothetical protein
MYTRVAEQNYYWTALCLKNPAYEGLLEPLAWFDVFETVERGRARWRLRQLREWRQLEEFLRRLLAAMVAVFPLSADTPLLVRVHESLFIWPSHYSYDGLWDSYSKAKQDLRVIRGAFMLQVAKLTFASYLLPAHWVETLVKRGKLTAEEASSVIASPIYQATGTSGAVTHPRVGLIVDVRRGSLKMFLQELEDLIVRFRLPVWFYFGERPGASEHPWASLYLRSATVIAQCRNTGTVGSHEKGWGEQITNQNEDGDEIERWGNNQTWAVGTASSNVTWDSNWTSALSSSGWERPAATSSRTILDNFTASPGKLKTAMAPRHPITRQRAGETPQEFFGYVEEETKARLTRMGSVQ